MAIIVGYARVSTGNQRLDRLGRSLPHLVATIDNLTRRGVNLKSLHEAIDTTSV